MESVDRRDAADVPFCTGTEEAAAAPGADFLQKSILDQCVHLPPSHVQVNTSMPRNRVHRCEQRVSRLVAFGTVENEVRQGRGHWFQAAR
jgi:hypothetical protein